MVSDRERKGDKSVNRSTFVAGKTAQIQNCYFVCVCMPDNR